MSLLDRTDPDPGGLLFTLFVVFLIAGGMAVTIADLERQVEELQGELDARPVVTVYQPRPLDMDPEAWGVRCYAIDRSSWRWRSAGEAPP